MKCSKFYTFTRIPTHRRLRHLSPASLMTQIGRNAATGLPSSWHLWTKAVLNWCLACFWAKCHQRVKIWNFEHLIQLRIMHILFCLSYLLILWTVNKDLLRYVQQNFCHLRSFVFCKVVERVTPLKCGEIYDMDFVANFMDNKTVKKFRKLVNMFLAYERMCSGTVFIATRCTMTLRHRRNDLCLLAQL